MLPASAGMILRGSSISVDRICAPRICGDDPTPIPWDQFFEGCSPHLRG